MRKFLLVILVLLSTTGAADSNCENYRIHHTNFPLTGYHLLTKCACEECHLGGVWKGTPRTCNECHNGTRSNALAKPGIHIPTTLQCGSCHTTISFSTGVNTNHTTFAGQCLSCHNGSYAAQGARGKPGDHPRTTLSCDSAGCHNTRSFAN